jgi:hypothetical protein
MTHRTVQMLNDLRAENRRLRENNERLRTRNEVLENLRNADEQALAQADGAAVATTSEDKSFAGCCE